MATLHAFDVIKESPDWEKSSFIVIFGDELFLRRQVVDAIKAHAESAGGLPSAVIDGDEATWADVVDEVSTRSLFASDSRRFAIVEPAEAFVSAYREKLEHQATISTAPGCIVLVVSSWPATTRLYKTAERESLQIDCRQPMKSGGKSIDDNRVRDWIIAWAHKAHGLRIDASAATELYETSGRSLGMIDQDLAKLSLLVPVGQKVDIEAVKRIVGGWRQKTVWDIVDAALDGAVVEAMAQLDHLLASGEAGVAVLAQISFVLRRYSAVAERLGRNSRKRRRESFEELALACGFRDWPKGSLRTVEQRISRIGKGRTTSLHRWLMELDVALKSTHASPDRTRFALERLFLRLGGPATL